MTNTPLDTRCLWKKPWWNTTDVIPPLTSEELDSSRDICREQIGISPLVLGRRILLRAPLLSSEGGMIFPELSQDLQSKKVQIGFVLAVGKHAYPPSEVYGIDGHQVFCRPGDWVEYAFWEKSESILNINSSESGGDAYQLYYVNDLNINSVIQPKDYHIILGSRY